MPLVDRLQILHISIYYASEGSGESFSEGDHGRVIHYGGEPACNEILQNEIDGNYYRYIDGRFNRWTGRSTGKLLVAGTPLETPLPYLFKS